MNKWTSKNKFIDWTKGFQICAKIVNDQSNTNHDVRNEIIYNTEVLESDHCDYNDAYILVKGNITVIATPATEYSSTSLEGQLEHDGVTIFLLLKSSKKQTIVN